MKDVIGLHDGRVLEDPERVVLAGDWHGNSEWAVSAIHAAADALSGEQHSLILHAGDFGYWPGTAGAHYLSAVSEELAERDIELWFVDGNHEWHPALRRVQHGTIMVAVAPLVSWLPRGRRWIWHGRRWLALGGAVSVDRAVRTEGRDWWPEEAITEDEADTISAAGAADVMLCHDAPSSVRLRLGQPSRHWAVADLARADAHRERLGRVVEAVGASHVIHGHYHDPLPTVLDKPDGLTVHSLNRDGATGNLHLLDVRSMQSSEVTVR